MYRNTVYIGVYGLAIVLMVISNYLKGGSAYYSLVYAVDNRLQHILLSLFFVSLIYAGTQLFVSLVIGKLTPLEAEAVQESGVKYLGSVCLVVTLFADDITVKGATVFALIFGLKVVHWIIGLRIEAMEKNGEFLEEVGKKMGVVCGGLLCANLALAVKFAEVAVAHPGVNILFAFEFAILTAFSIKCIYSVAVLKYVREKSIEERIFLMFYGDFSFGVFKVLAHVCCLIWTTLHFRMPINLLREALYIVKHLSAKAKAVMAYKKLLTELETYQDISGEELGDSRTCLICHEEMEVAKKLKCSHFFHLNCLKEWLHRQQVCPVCRKEVLEKKTPGGEERETQSSRVYFIGEEMEYEGIPVTLEDRF